MKMTLFGILVVPLLLFGAPQVEPTSKFGVGLYVVVDPQVVSDFVELGYNQSSAENVIRRDISFIFNEVNRYYSSMKRFGLDLSVYIKKLTMANTTVIGRNELFVTMTPFFDFQKWLKDTKAYDDVPYDVAIYFNGPPRLRNGEVGGLGIQKTVCLAPNQASIMLANYYGTQETAFTIAHELAHNLGASHDQPPCSEMGGVMSLYQDFRYNKAWRMSACAAKEINETMTTNCGSDHGAHARPRHPLNIASYYNDDIMDPDKLCQRYYMDNTVTACKDLDDGGKEDTMCSSLKCRLTSDPRDSCERFLATEGMACGDKGDKRCSRGYCVSATK